MLNSDEVYDSYRINRSYLSNRCYGPFEILGFFKRVKSETLKREEIKDKLLSDIC